MSLTIDELLIMQSSLIEQMTKFVSNTKKTAIPKRTHGYYLSRVNGWHDLWQQFRSNEEKIALIKTEDDLDKTYFSEDHYSIQEALYYEFKGELIDYVEKFEKLEKAHDPTTSPNSTAQSDTRETHSTHTNLPRISLPKFSGDYNEWIAYRDLYLSVIHQNTNLENVQKFHYLKTTLSGEAANIIKHISITNANYADAWKALTARFDHKRFLVSAILKTFTSLTKITSESATSLKNLLDVANECLVSLNNMGINTIEWDPIIIHLLTQKLPFESHKVWEESLGDCTDVPTWKQFKSFLESRFRTLEAISGSKPKQSNIKSENKQNIHTFYSASNSCTFCKNKAKHSIRSCAKFLKSNSKERLNFAKSKGCCLNCLGQYHSINKCLSLSRCNECGEKHHSLLHEAMHKNKNEPGSNNQKTVKSNLPTYPNKQGDKSTGSNIASHFAARNKHVLLATAMVYIKTNEENYMARALIDSGSQATFITNSAIRRMKLQVSSTLVNVTGLGNTNTAVSHRMTKLTITNSDLSQEITLNAVALESLTDLLPPRFIKQTRWEHLNGLPLADPSFYVPDRVDILIGADIYPMIIQEGVKMGPPGTPLAQKTIFGWILTGEVDADNYTKPKVASLMNSVEVSFDLQKFWELEETPIKNILSKEDEFCEEFFKKTCQRNVDGSYIVRLPFKHLLYTNFDGILGSSKNTALTRYLSLEKNLQRKDILKEYNDVLRDYLMSTHMEKIPKNQATESYPNKANCSKLDYTTYYLPHHAVFKESSSTTKLRVVFDASCNTKSKFSLNDMLLTGPTLQQDITAIIMRWRFHRYVFTADIEKMYRQIWLDSQDTDYQRILWRATSKGPIEDYRLLTVTFGVSCAPYLAIRTLHQLASDEKSKYPEAAKSLLNDFYVDDVLTGGDSIHQVNALKHDLIALLKGGGFHLRKFSANHPKITNDLPSSDISPETLKQFEGGNMIKTLGIFWDQTDDFFRYKVNFDVNGPPTKRNILSQIAKLFDPLGWLSPIIICGKILMQKLWLAGVDWDTPIPIKLQNEWYKFSMNIKRIEEIKLPRWLEYSSSHTLEFHGFCDSSERAYAAVIYARIKSTNGNVVTNLIMAKTKVAPVKTVSLPRLELCGAHLLAKLVHHVRQALGPHYKYFVWTDSTIVLSWINSHPSRWKSFVANRVTEILTHLPESNWRHVSSEDNPADLASRGVPPSELINQYKWWKGPEWLTKDELEWPKRDDAVDSPESLKELKKVRSYQITTNKEQLIERFSSYSRACRVIAYCYRYIDKMKTKKGTSFPTYLSTEELRRAKLIFIKQSQEESYSYEINDLKNNLKISKKSSIIALNPFLDADGILRVGGRLEHANLEFSEKHPIILARRSKLTALLIDHIHLITLHGGPNLVLSQIKRKFWIPGVKITIRQRLHLCLTCYRWSKFSTNQIMGNLPHDRINLERPFYAVGIDFAGPINIKLNKVRNARLTKAYICIFICFATKAVHIEAVSDLTSEAFLAALRRFFSRRGVCKEIYTDNGTNFVGAHRILEKELQQALKLNLQTAAEQGANQNINWHFIPPGAPHFGGLWEAGVKSIKYHLKRIIGQANLTFEELTTTLTQIEAVLNSRPLCALSSDPEDFNPLTPGHFLIGNAPLSLPELDWSSAKVSHLSRWQYLQKLRHDFWKRWVSEYLPRLQQRSKWKIEQPSIRTGDLVLLKDDTIPPSGWKFARIVETHPGKDSNVRVVTLRTPYTTLKRPITKICLLPFHNDS